MKSFFLPISEFRRLQSRAYRAQKNDQSEVGGVILSWKKAKLELIFLKNYSTEPRSYILSEIEVKQERAIALKRGRRAVGYFHSHPVSEAIPGPRDRKNFPLNRLQLIYDVCGREARLWRVVKINGKRKLKELPLFVEKGQLTGR